MNYTILLQIKKWLTERISLDGTVLIAAGVAYLVFHPIAVYVAYASIAYGIYTIWKKES
jgi:hypothetical protein